MATISGEGAARAALATLRCNGGFQVVLRMPGLAVSGSDAEQLGLAAPDFEDVPIGPAAWRKVGVSTELLLDGHVVARLMSSEQFASAESLFQAAVGVVVSDVLYAITKSEPLLVAGVPCAYRLSLRAPAWA